MDLAISPLATGCAGVAPTHIAPDDDYDEEEEEEDNNDNDNDDNNVDDDDDDDDDNDDDDEPEVLSAARHAQHDQPGQTHARQPANNYLQHCLFIFYIGYLYHCLSLILIIYL